MRAVFRILFDDVRSIKKSFMAVLLMVGISILPALYAWVNIYASWDPYGNTGNVSVAVTSEDPGVTLDDGSFVNKASEVMDELKESDSIGWKFVKSRKSAVEGVRSGKYYAAIVFEDNFTYNMYHLKDAVRSEKAALTFYQNAKRNAIAAKITDTAAEALQQNINSQYLQTVFSTVFGETKALTDETEEKKPVDAAVEELEHLRSTLGAYDETISVFLANNKNVASNVSRTMKDLKHTRSTSKKIIDQAKADMKDARKSVQIVENKLNSLSADIGKDLNKLEKDVAAIGPNPAEKQAIDRVRKESNALLKELQELKALLPTDSKLPGIKLVINTVDSMIFQIQNMEELLNQLPATQEDVQGIIHALQSLHKSGLLTGLKSMTRGLEDTVNAMPPILKALEETLDDATPMMDATGDTVNGVESALVQFQKLLRLERASLKKIIDDVNAAADKDKLDTLIDRLGGNSKLYGEFFSSMVKTELEEYYPMASFGAAMTPFYTNLALWIGGVILVALLKTEVDRRKYPGLSNTQAFFGRYLLFFLLGQAQTVVTVLGDIYLLHCEPAHPWLLWLAASIASAVFVMFNYAMTMTFGPIGKAMVVVIMVLQIAGSSGSFPIELLPPLFEKIFRFFPFPYAINAMREAIAGLYGHDYVIYLMQLTCFAVVSILVGLVIRRSFAGVTHFVAEELEETEVL